jgi:hypothetical protein
VDASDVLRLEVRNFQGPERWDWALSTAAGEHLAYHEVRLDPESLEYQAMTRLQFYVRWRAERERPLESEAEFLGQVGQWMGERVFGDIGRTLVEWRPVTALVVVPSGAEVLRHWPFELAWVDGQALAMQEVSLVFDVSGGAVQGLSRAKVPIGERLRMLAVFSLPAEEPLLLLSQQRYELVRSIERVAASTGRSVSLVTVQHGVTRKRLGEILKQGEGWDVIHFSGHGLASRLLLEGADGHTDPVPTDELLQMLRFARSRLKLLVLSSCESGAAAGNEAIRVGVSPASAEAGEDLDDRRPLSAVAVEAARQLDCAVLGMRYRVSDDFSIELAHHLYDNLFHKQNVLPRALQLALPEALEHWPEPGNPPLSVATPALFGPRGVGLSLVPPVVEPSFALAGLKMSYFDREPELFVGRVEPMAAASRALASDDRFSGVLFHAPGPTGKTACAVELAYLYKDQFRRLVRHQAPAHRNEIAGSLVGLAESLETQLEQFGPIMKQAARSRAELERFLPKLKELMEQRAILVYIDGIEELLTTEGNWRDDMWRLVIDALLDDSRASRLVLTSRRRPAKLHDRLCVIPVPPLSPEEALLLARQLPRLGAVLRGRTDLPMDRAVTLLADTLAAAAGMPGTIYEADEQLTPPGVLDELPARTAELARAAGTHDETTGTREEYLWTVHEWTRGIRRSSDTSAARGSAVPATSAYSPGRQVDSAPSTQVSAIHKPKRKKAGPRKKELRAEPENEVRMTREQHLSISAAESGRISDSLTSGTVGSNEPEVEPQMPDLSVLSGAIKYHSALSQLIPELNTLDDIPEFPRHATGESIFKWQYLTGAWLAKAERILTEASALAAIRESRSYPSVRLAQATADANTGLTWIRQLVAHAGESSDTDRFLRRCEETVAAISEIVAYTAGS